MIRRTLSYIDARLMEHGDRVAYIARAIALEDPACALDLDKLFILCFLHDIGAYKTEEIDDMVRFETGDTQAHAIYGYLFLRSTTQLGEYAESILYHHTDYAHLREKRCFCEDYAALIYLADRVDILLQTAGPKALGVLREQAGSRFKPEYVELFFQAEAKKGLSAKTLGGGFRAELEQIVQSLDVSDAAVMEYLSMLVYAVDFRSPFTVTHTINTMGFSQALGERMDLPEEDMQNLYLGAFLHDVGKIAIPISILESPNRLTPEETAVMREHVTKTEEIITGVVSDPICQIAVRHHEKLDGSGYPHGLTAAQLTLPQRIVAVADILSALISRRSYKAPYPKEKTIGIIAGMRDRGELCPVVCELLLTRYDEIIAQSEQRSRPVVALYEKLQSDFERIRAERM